jgi:hypothetical protein
LKAIEESTEIARQPQPALSGDVALMFERLAKDQSVDVAKLEKLIAMQERILAYQAKADFDAAFSDMQGELPEINERGQIKVGEEVRSTYATNEDIQKAVKPILQKHGFSIRFRNEWLDGNRLKIVGILSHRSGHSERDEFVAGADTSGSKNAIQALGSTRAYGQRYTTIALLNIATRGEDDDGESSEAYKVPAAPDGYGEWWGDMTACADEGWPKLSQAWGKSKDDFRKYTSRFNKTNWEAIKLKAQRVSK